MRFITEFQDLFISISTKGFQIGEVAFIVLVFESSAIAALFKQINLESKKS